MPPQIIVGYEDTPGGRDAIALAGLLAETMAASVTVVTIFPWRPGLLSENEVDQALERETAGVFAAAREALSEGVTTLAIAHRSAAEALDDLATSRQASLIAIGASHRAAVGRTLLGSVGESLIHGAPCAVAIAPRGYATEQGRHLLKIGVAFDGSTEAWSALETAIGLAGRLHGEITVVAVADYPRYGYATSWSILTTGEFHDFELEQTKRELELGLGRIPAGVPKEGRLLTGNPGSLLAEVSGEFDLFVAGSRGHGQLRRTVLGSSTRRLIAEAACPVLVLPRAAPADPLGLRGR